MFFKDPWINSTMYKLRDHVQFAGHIEHNAMLFTVTGPIPTEVEAQFLRADTSEQDVLNAFDWTEALTKEFLSRGMVRAMRASFLANPTGKSHNDFAAPGWPSGLEEARTQLQLLRTQRCSASAS